MNRLIFYANGQLLFTSTLRPSRTLIGRSDRCDISLPGEVISRTHCIVELRDEQLWLINRSQRGTQVNGLTVQRHLLRAGDRIAFGPYEALLHKEEPLKRDATTALFSPRSVSIETSSLALTPVNEPSASPLFLRLQHCYFGGPSSSFPLEGHTGERDFHIHLSRGRPMIVPAGAPARLNGSRVRQPTPLCAGDRLTFGAHEFLLVDEAPAADTRGQFGEMVGQSPLSKQLFHVLKRMSAHRLPVLLCGQSGTGKELAAREVHARSKRSEGPFVALNCAAITLTLFESTLFGHEKGSFTGATQRQEGVFQQANRGSLFLDEIGELQLEAQAKLLRALESGEVRRVGSTKPEFPDVRIIAATNRDLQAMVRAGTFREDLYYRLAVLSIRLPSLVDRIDDLPHIARTLLDRSHPSASLTPRAIRRLQGYHWPGNIRELRNVLTRSVVLFGDAIDAEQLQFQPWCFGGPDSPPDAGPATKQHIIDALILHDGNRSHTAKALAMPRSTLIYKIRRYGIEIPPPNQLEKRLT